MKVQRIGSITVAFVLVGSLAFAIGGDKAMYMGGTLNSPPQNTEGRLNTQTDNAIVFAPDKAGTPGIAIPYASITELEYGQKAGRRVAMAIMISPVALFSKKRNHYLTITYKDDAGKEQAAVFEIGKDIVRTTIKIVETRSGKPVTFQDDEAKKSLGGGH